MCGRYALDVSPDSLPDEFGKQGLHVDEVQGSDVRSHHQYNIGPMCTVPVYYCTIQNSNNHQEQHLFEKHLVQYMKWSLIPSWIHNTDQSKKTYPTFNARYEALDHSKLWKSVLHQRCVVPIRGYFEWKTYSKNQKEPYFIKRKDDTLMFLAGFYSKTTIDANEVYSFTIVTREAPKQLVWLHERMPVVLDPGTEDFSKWLEPKKKNLDDVKSYLKVYNKTNLEWYRVGSDVGNVKNEGKKLIEPFKESKNNIMSMMSTSPKKVKPEPSEANVIEDVKKEEKKQDEIIQPKTELETGIKLEKSPIPRKKRVAISDLLKGSPSKKKKI
ncbi:hypothetical protein CANARDRAFT_202617 [[Candida] arabinofermentans NRRL YB-2248]|uniref:DUF159-domain-containing protein n=1 Tax=[Candida] arabinofermentans NRRL YB-2248 TaxID=983967 RepID=A0A1E4SW72_9ASCO|nr:hypothetical protein CANARDRAFT_202617 [[Candida] arabinofermentans NRRL YB-2248]